MKEATLSALKESIAKWEVYTAGDHRGKIGTHTCPLCRLYSSKSDITENCIGCPVYERTGYQYCSNTPYYPYAADRTDANAQKEVDFLKSLLPLEDEPKPEEEKKEEKFIWENLNYLEKKEKDLWT